MLSRSSITLPRRPDRIRRADCAILPILFRTLVGRWLIEVQPRTRTRLLGEFLSKPDYVNFYLPYKPYIGWIATPLPRSGYTKWYAKERNARLYPGRHPDPTLRDLPEHYDN